MWFQYRFPFLLNRNRTISKSTQIKNIKKVIKIVYAWIIGNLRPKFLLNNNLFFIIFDFQICYYLIFIFKIFSNSSFIIFTGQSWIYILLIYFFPFLILCYKRQFSLTIYILFFYKEKFIGSSSNLSRS